MHFMTCPQEVYIQILVKWVYNFIAMDISSHLHLKFNSIVFHKTDILKGMHLKLNKIQLSAEINIDRLTFLCFGLQLYTSS